MALQSCLCHGPVRQAHGPSIFLGVLRSGVSLSNPEVLEGSITHLKCSYGLIIAETNASYQIERITTFPARSFGVGLESVRSQ